MTPTKLQSRTLPVSLILLALLLALPYGPVRAEEPGASGESDAGATAKKAADPDKPLPAPPATVKVEGSLPYIPTSNTIATRLPIPWRLTPANVGTVSDLLLREQHALVLGDALTNVSGINVQTVSDVVDYFGIRGFDSLSSGLVLTDGAPEPEVTFYQMYNVDRIEVFKGPAGFLYGSNPLAGVVNIVRRQPVPGTFGSAGASFGSFATYDSTVDYNTSTQDGKYAFRINSAWRQSDFYRDDKNNRNSAVNPAFTWRIGARSSLNVNLEYVDSRYSPDSGLPLVGNRIADVPRTRSYQSPFDDSAQNIGRAQIDFETQLSDSWVLRNKAYYRDLDWKSSGTLFNGVFPNFITGRPEVSRVLPILDDTQRFVGDQLEGVLTASTGSVGHKLLAGVEVARFGDDFTLDVANLPNIDLNNPHETAHRPLTLIPGQSAAGDSRTIVLAPYVIDQIRFSDKFHALAGARFDVIDFEDRVTGTGRHDKEVSPYGGFVYSPTETLSFYANAGGAFAPPSNRVPVASRRPERSRQYEIGTKLDRLAGRLQLTLAAYRMERENIAIPDDNGFTQQSGDQRSRGIELELAAEPVARLRTFVSYALNDSELTRFTERVIVGFDPNPPFTPIFATVDRSGNTPTFAPRHIANLWVSRQFDSGLGLGGGARYVSGQFIAEDNLFSIDGYVTYDAAVTWTKGEWGLSLNLKNLTGREYETRGFGSTSVLPAAGFAAYGGIQRRF